MPVQFKEMSEVGFKDGATELIVDYASWHTYQTNPLGTGEVGKVGQAILVNVGGRYLGKAVIGSSGLVEW